MDKNKKDKKGKKQVMDFDSFSNLINPEPKPQVSIKPRRDYNNEQRKPIQNSEPVELSRGGKTQGNTSDRRNELGIGNQDTLQRGVRTQNLQNKSTNPKSIESDIPLIRGTVQQQPQHVINKENTSEISLTRGVKSQEVHHSNYLNREPIKQNDIVLERSVKKQVMESDEIDHERNKDVQNKSTEFVRGVPQHKIEEKIHDNLKHPILHELQRNNNQNKEIIFTRGKSQTQLIQRTINRQNEHEINKEDNGNKEIENDEWKTVIYNKNRKYKNNNKRTRNNSSHSSLKNSIYNDKENEDENENEVDEDNNDSDNSDSDNNNSNNNEISSKEINKEVVISNITETNKEINKTNDDNKLTTINNKSEVLKVGNEEIKPKQIETNKGNENKITNNDDKYPSLEELKRQALEKEKLTQLSGNSYFYPHISLSLPLIYDLIEKEKKSSLTSDINDLLNNYSKKFLLEIMNEIKLDTYEYIDFIRMIIEKSFTLHEEEINTIKNMLIDLLTEEYMNYYHLIISFQSFYYEMDDLLIDYPKAKIVCDNMLSFFNTKQVIEFKPNNNNNEDITKLVDYFMGKTEHIKDINYDYILYSIVISSYINDNIIYDIIDNHNNCYYVPFIEDNKLFLIDTIGQCSIDKQLKSLNKMVELLSCFGLPNNVLESIFFTLYDLDIILEPTFIKWNNSLSDSVEMKKAKKQLEEWFVWLINAEYES